MNEIERIEEVMQIIKTKHMCQDLDGDCTKQDRIDYRARFAALKAGAAALREKAEREKGCAACGLLYTIHAESYGIEDLDCANEPIDNKFCPMCGKKLEVEP